MERSGRIRYKFRLSLITSHSKLGIRSKLMPKDYVADTIATAEVLVNSSFFIYGNFESSSSNGKITLISNKTNEEVPNGMKLVIVIRSTEFHYMTTAVSADVDSGYYHIEVEHLGRKDTLPTIHLIYKRPVFDYLGKTYTIVDNVTLNVMGQSGVNTGISAIYFEFSSAHPYTPGSVAGVTFQSYEGLTAFPTELYDKPIALNIVGQDRKSIKFISPDIPAGYYSNWIDTGLLAPSSINLFFDFESTEWGKNNRLSIGGV
ncbi:hypothetical protein SAMN05216436_10154 [bacterium A37T11]|nr:hypothetical protein SAMN05216436_10154 [bacterium A37T11]